MRAGISVNLHGIGHLTSIGARFDPDNARFAKRNCRKNCWIPHGDSGMRVPVESLSWMRETPVYSGEALWTQSHTRLTSYETPSSG